MPGGVASMAAFRNHCCERDLGGSKELLAESGDARVLWFAFSREEEVRPLLRELWCRNGFLGY